MKKLKRFNSAVHLLWVAIKNIERERDFYKEQLDRIALQKRKTIAQHLAQSALTFWSQLHK